MSRRLKWSSKAGHFTHSARCALPSIFSAPAKRRAWPHSIISYPCAVCCVFVSGFKMRLRWHGHRFHNVVWLSSNNVILGIAVGQFLRDNHVLLADRMSSAIKAGPRYKALPCVLADQLLHSLVLCNGFCMPSFGWIPGLQG